MRTDTGPAAHVDRYSCQSLVEPTGAPPWLRVSRVARVGPRGARVQNNELAANWAPAIADKALMSAEANVATEKLPPGFKGAVATSRRLAHSCAPAGVESVVNATSCSVARSWASPPVVSRLNASTSPASRASVSASSHQVR